MKVHLANRAIAGQAACSILWRDRKPLPRKLTTDRTLVTCSQCRRLLPPPRVLVSPDVHAAAAALGRLGGKKGGLARAAALSPERRKEIARQGAEARWGKR